MKERCGIGVAGVLLLLFTCGSSKVHNLQEVQGSNSAVENIGPRETRDTVSELGRLNNPAGGGSVSRAWSKRGPNIVGGQGDINRHLVIDVSDGATPAAVQARPAARPARPPPAEIVLGFETSGQQVASKGASPSDVRPPSRQNALGFGQPADGIVRPVQRGPVATPAGQAGREDISIEVDTGSGGARGLPMSPQQRASQPSLGQIRGRAVPVQPGRRLGQRRLAKSPRQLNRPVMTGQGVRSGNASPRDSISVTADFSEDQYNNRGGADRVSPPAVGAASPVGADSGGSPRRAQPPQWLPEQIPGQAGVDYPTLRDLPQSSFDCRSQGTDGFYADTTDEARCQAFWVCHNDQQDGFLCPNGTIFNQRYLACDWWFNVRCQESPQYYEVNRNIGVLGTRIHSQPGAAPPAAAATGVHPVLTLLHDILQYPRVPPVLPFGSSESPGENEPVHSAVQPALPSRNQYSDDGFDASEKSSVSVSGGVPGIPPAEGRRAGQMSSQESISSVMRVSEGSNGLPRRHVKRHTRRAPSKHSARSFKKHRGSTQLRERKTRDDIVQIAEGAESAESALSAQIPQIEQMAVSQLKKRTPEPSSGAFTSVQEGNVPDRQRNIQPGRSGPLLQTVDKVAFPMDLRGPDFPKVEEDFNVQEASGMRKSTSIKSVLPSLLDIPQPGAVNVMAVSGSQQNPDVDVGSQKVSGNRASFADLSDKQNVGVPGNYAGISLTEDVRLDKDVHDQVAGAISDSEAEGVSLMEDVAFDKKNSIPAPSPAAAPQTNTDPKSTSVLESVAGDNGQGPGVIVQENVQVDQKRDVSGVSNQGFPVVPQAGPQTLSNQPFPAVPQATNEGNNNSPGLSVAENVQVGRNGNGYGPPSNANAPAVMGNPAPGGGGPGAGVSLTENVQIGHNGNAPANGPSQIAQPMSGDSSGLAGQAAAGDLSTGINGHPGGEMNVEAFLSDQNAARAPAPAPPASSGIRSEESVEVDFDKKPANQYQGAEASQSQGQPLNSPQQAPAEAAQNMESPENQAQMDPNVDRGHDAGETDRIKIPPNAEQVLEEQSNVKILIPYDGKDGGVYVPSGPTASDDQIGNFGIGSQVNSGIALGTHIGTQDSPKGQSQDQSQQSQNQPQDPPQGQLSNQVQSQPQGQVQSQPQVQVQNQLQPQRRDQQSQYPAGGLLGGPPGPGPAGILGGRTPSQPGLGKDNLRIAEDVNVHRESGSLGGISNIPSGGAARPGYSHAGDARMNASALTIPKKDGSSKILEELDARSQFVSKVGDEPGTVKTHVQMAEEKLGDKPGITDLLDDPSALKKEMPSENVKLTQQQQTPPPEPQGEIIPGRQNVQITSESVSRIIKNPARHRMVIKDPSGLDLPELLRPPGFGTNYSPFKAYPTLRTVKPVSPATPQPSVARLAGSIDMKSGNNAPAAGPAAASPNTRTLTAGISERQMVGNSGGVNTAPGPQRIERGDLSDKLSNTLKMVDNILGPPPFKSKRNIHSKLQRAAYLDSMESGHPSSLKGRGQKRASDGDPQDGNMGINLTVLINDQQDGQTASGQTSAAAAASAGQWARPAHTRHRPAAREKEKIRIFDSLKDMARKKPKAQKRKKHKLKQTAEETEIKDIIEVKTSGDDDDDDSDKTYDYDISQLPSWMKLAVKSHVKPSHSYS